MNDELTWIVLGTHEDEGTSLFGEFAKETSADRHARLLRKGWWGTAGWEFALTRGERTVEEFNAAVARSKAAGNP